MTERMTTTLAFERLAGLATVLVLIGSALAVPIALAVEGIPPLPDQTTLIALICLGLIPTAGANILRVLVIRTAGPVFMSLVNYQVPLWSVLLGAWLLNEPLPSALLGAMMLILTGVALSQWPALRSLFRH